MPCDRERANSSAATANASAGSSSTVSSTSLKRPAGAARATTIARSATPASAPNAYSQVGTTWSPVDDAGARWGALVRSPGSSIGRLRRSFAVVHFIGIRRSRRERRQAARAPSQACYNVACGVSLTPSTGGPAVVLSRAQSPATRHSQEGTPCHASSARSRDCCATATSIPARISIRAPTAPKMPAVCFDPQCRYPRLDA